MKERKIGPPFEFLWFVPNGGFQWSKAASLQRVFQGQTVDRTGTFLVEKPDPQPQRRWYKPLESQNGLFRTLAQLKPTMAAVAEFAGQYGTLGGDSCSEAVMVDGRNTYGETFSAWTGEITRLQSLIDLWDAIRARDLQHLAKWITWKDDGTVYYEWRTRRQTRRGLLAAPGYPDNLSLRFSPGDVLLPARYALQRELNEALAKHPSMPKLLWTRRNSGRDLTLSVAPNCLISAIWLQFAYAVAGDWSYRTCQVCGKWFHIGPGASMRADAKYCSNACRQRRFRARKGNKSGTHKES